jgi:membrane protease YdiL (CAAX protease family)
MKIFEVHSSEVGCATALPSSRRPVWDIVELLIGYGIIVAVVWTQRPMQRWLYFGAIAWFLVSTVVSFPGWRVMGCSIIGFWRSFWVVGVAVLLAIAAALLASSLHTLHHPGSPVQWVRAFGGYTIWALTQQLLLQGYFLIRLLRIIPSRVWAVITAGTVFALIHLPNPVLTPVTLLWGLAACFVFLRFRNIYPLAIAHAIFGISVAITVPATIHHNMRVGLGYLTYRAPQRVHLSQIDQKVSTDAWLRAEAPTRR